MAADALAICVGLCEVVQAGAGMAAVGEQAAGAGSTAQGSAAQHLAEKSRLVSMHDLHTCAGDGSRYGLQT